MTYLRLAIAAVWLLALAATAPPLAAQEMTLSEESELWIDGTSNRDDWTVYAQEMSAVAGEMDGTVPGSLRLTVTADMIKSQKSTIMDRLMYQTLKVDEHPVITYEMIEAVPSEDDETLLHTTGQLTLAGVTNEVEMDVQAERLDDGSIRYTGNSPLKLTNYGMRPPTAMFGALRTGDDVTIHFDVVFASDS
ncbi:MAG: YceI family protein [Rhodothermales bacterium]